MLTLGLILGVFGLAVIGSSDMLTIRKIVVEGGERLTDDDVQGMTNIKVGDNFIGVDLQAATMRLQQHPWVRSARIFLQYPRLRVVIQERRPFVAVQLSKQDLVWCDEEGFVLAPYSSQERETQSIIIEGLGAAAGDANGSRIGNGVQWKAIRRLLRTSFSDLFVVDKLRFFAEWVDLFTQEQQRIRLPLTGLNEALGRLQPIWTLLEKRVFLHSLDLRFPGEIVYEGTPH